MEQERREETGGTSYRKEKEERGREAGGGPVDPTYKTRAGDSIFGVSGSVGGRMEKIKKGEEFRE